MAAITEAGCMAHSRRKFFDLHVSSKSQIAQQACTYISQLYDIEREIKTLGSDERLDIRQARSNPLADKFRAWMLLALNSMALMGAAGSRSCGHSE
ncbi:MAG: transposase [Comamonadaceae bacterium]|nr:transposase [Comamonadaceae bacterium]